MRIAIACIFAALMSIAAESAPVSFGAKLEPPVGRVISGWSGDAAGLATYGKIMTPHAPAMISFDAALDFSTASPFLERYRKFNAAHGFFVGDVGLRFRGYEHDVSIGMRDPDIIVTADGLRDVGLPVLLRVGYDFNDPLAAYEPSSYIGAFRHIADLFHRECPNTAMVWSATASGFSDPHYLKWYPGDDKVDWWGVDLPDPADIRRAETVVFIEAAQRHRKPIMINADGTRVKSEAEALKWLELTFDFIRAHPSIKAIGFAPGVRLLRWPKAAAYLKKQLADPRFIDALEAPAIFHPAGSQE